MWKNTQIFFYTFYTQPDRFIVIQAESHPQLSGGPVEEWSVWACCSPPVPIQSV